MARTGGGVEALFCLLQVHSQLEEEQLPSLTCISARKALEEPAQVVMTWQAGILLYFEMEEQCYLEFEVIGRCF